MKKILIIILIHSLFIIIPCEGQIVGKSKNVSNSKSDTAVYIIDPVILIPFEVKRETMYSILPDSLGGKRAKGLSFLTLNINEHGEIKNYIINRLYLHDGKIKIIDYWNKNSAFVNRKDYPTRMLKYYPFFDLYVHNLIIVPNDVVKPELENKIIIMIRF